MIVGTIAAVVVTVAGVFVEGVVAVSLGRRQME
jgi:hypothetical protein